jgi:phenylacetic acid degradation operon negative regulatory protein
VIDTILNTPPTPKRLVLSLLSVPGVPEISVRQFTSWAALFDIDAAAMRVAIGRLVKAGLLCAAGRGVYRIGPRGESLSRTARGWRQVEDRLQDWRGEWLLVHTAHLGRSNRSALRAREQAMRLEGLKPLRPELWCRPANYRETLDATRLRLIPLGLPKEAVMLKAEALADDLAAEAAGLWPTVELEAGYARLQWALADSSSRLPRLALDDAARESFLIGEAVIRSINADPLLPEQFIDVAARRKLVSAMLAYDSLGRDIWASFQDSVAA